MLSANPSYLVKAIILSFSKKLNTGLCGKGGEQPFLFAFQGKFVAAFGQSNEGDVSPNTKGPHCLDTGLPCDTNTSTCNGRVGKRSHEREKFCNQESDFIFTHSGFSIFLTC